MGQLAPSFVRVASTGCPAKLKAICFNFGADRVATSHHDGKVNKPCQSYGGTLLVWVGAMP